MAQADRTIQRIKSQAPEGAAGEKKVTKPILRSLGFLLLTGVLLLPSIAKVAHAQGAPAQTAPAPGEKKFTLVSEQIGETKFWLPSTIAVEPGDKVTLVLKNEVPGATTTHGFSLPAFNITEVVTRGTPVTVHFTADKAGVYPYFCQLHPAHVGGQLLVEPSAK